MNRKNSEPLPIWAVILLDAFAVTLGLLVFALFHHVLPREAELEPLVLTSPTPTAEPVAEPLPSETEEPEIEATPEPEPEPEIGDFSLSFPEQFTDGEIICTKNEYRSANVCVRYMSVQKGFLLYHVADIYVRRLEYFRTAFAHGEFRNEGMSYSEPFETIASDNDAVVAISGDYYGGRLEGVVIRNGVLYRETPNEAVCAIFPDGRMECISAEDYDVQYLVDNSAWQAWAFGPILVKDGVAIDNSKNSIFRKNPRSALGCIEPGHYCFVQVEGRIKESGGITLNDLSELMLSLGCVQAYNLDGGESSYIYWNGQLASTKFNRQSSDIIYIADGFVEGGKES